MFARRHSSNGAAQVSGSLLPAAPVEHHAGLVARLDGAPEAPPVQTGERQQMPQACRVTRVGRWSLDCVAHGRQRVDELSYPERCPLDTSLTIAHCSCSDVRYRAMPDGRRVSICVDCQRVWKVWPASEGVR